MSVAQKLCDDIVVPALIPSTEAVRQTSFSQWVPHSSRYESKPTRSVVIEKQTVINKIKSDKGGSQNIIREFQSTETLLDKEFVDEGNNTIVTGPLRCDNNCSTVLQKRDTRCNCKFPLKRNIIKKSSAKQIQTFEKHNCFNLDKACAHCVQTVNCGTQFYETKPSLPFKQESEMLVDKESRTNFMTQSLRHNFATSTTSRPSNTKTLTARRWALSQSPVYGPDF